MKKLFLAISGLAMATASASAADMAVKAPAYKAPPMEVFSWTGFYIGGDVGGEWGRFRDTLSVPAVTAFGVTAPAVTIPLGSNNSSFTGGGQIGYRWQSPSNWVLGVEGDFNWVELKNTQTLTAALLPPTNLTFVAGDSLSLKTNWESSIRGSVGYAWGHFLAYVTGGVAFANVQASSNFIATTVGPFVFPASAGSQTKTLTGGTVGVGFAYAVNKNWDIGAEYRYTQYDGKDFAVGSVAALAGPGGALAFVPATAHSDLTTNEVRIRANYKFDWAGPVVARY
jgi:outer membrane immunogenic protein